MPIISSEPASARTSRTRMTGIGRVLVIVYGILALGATGRSVVQIIQDFQAAPVAYALSAVAAVVYILARSPSCSRDREAGIASRGSRSASSSPACSSSAR